MVEALYPDLLFMDLNVNVKAYHNDLPRLDGVNVHLAPEPYL